jgi:methylase of polypeptide subunit release factors
MRFKIILIALLSLAFFTTAHEGKLMPKVSQDAERYIDKMLNRSTPYSVQIHTATITITSTDVYPPGSLSRFFITYLLEHNLLKNKCLIDIGTGAGALAIAAAQAGAHSVIATDISNKAVQCAQANALANKVEDIITVIEGAGAGILLPPYKNSADIIVAGIPWDSLEEEAYAKLDASRSLLTRAFYDIEDALITSLVTDGFSLLKENATDSCMLITASNRNLPRIQSICKKHSVSATTAASADLHNDGNMHHIILLEQK